MAERRMFAKTIIDSDLFLDMSLSTQSLYFHLSMRADDEGFINNPKKIQRMIGAGDDELKILIAKSFIIPFASGICVIKHWKIHNFIRTDRYKETFYLNEKEQLNCTDSKVYELKNIEVFNTNITGIPNGNQKDTTGIPDVNQMDTQVRLGKARLGKVSLDTIGQKNSKAIPDNLQQVAEAWNSLNLSCIKSINNTRLKLLNSRIKEVGIEVVIEAINNISKSSFLKGQNDRGWIISFDWLVKPNNFQKVLEGNYINKEVKGNDSFKQNTSGQAEFKGTNRSSELRCSKEELDAFAETID